MLTFLLRRLGAILLVLLVVLAAFALAEGADAAAAAAAPDGTKALPQWATLTILFVSIAFGVVYNIRHFRFRAHESTFREPKASFASRIRASNWQAFVRP